MSVLAIAAIVVGAFVIGFIVGWKLGRWDIPMFGIVLACPSFARGQEILDPETESRAACKFLEQLPDSERVYYRLCSTYDVQWQERSEFSKLWSKIAMRQVTMSPNRRLFPSRVPDSNTLWWMDLRDWGWNDAAWRAVALRDKAFREPWVKPATARRMRGLIGERQPGSFHCVALVSAFSLYRRIYQTTESPDYYDLLFAEQRYPKTGKLEYRHTLKWFAGDAKWPAGFYGYLVAYPERKFIDFPANRDEWLSAFLGGIKTAEFDKAITNLRSRRGAVVRGMEEDSKNISFVGRNNRLAWQAPWISSFQAVYGETFDVKNAAGKRDLEENAFTDQDRDKKRVFRDGGELLITLPAGDGLAALVIDAKGKRVEEVPPDIAINTRDSHDRRVRNGTLACYACHADSYGWIPLANQIELTTPEKIDVRFQALRAGYKYGVKDKQAALDYDAFFIDWQDDLKPHRERMKNYWAQATGSKHRDLDDAWTGLEIAQLTLKWKHRYDAPVTFEQACAETGVPGEILRVAAIRSPLRRSQDVALKGVVARSAWDATVFPELMLILSASKEQLYGTARPLERPSVLIKPGVKP